MSRLKSKIAMLPGKPYQRLNKLTGKYEWVHPPATNLIEVMKKWPDDMTSKARRRKEK